MSAAIIGDNAPKGIDDGDTTMTTDAIKINWCDEPNGRVRFLYDFGWANGELGIYENAKGERFNADPDHGGLPDCDVIPVEVMVRRHVKDEWVEGEWDWDFEGYAMIDDIPRNAYVWIPGVGPYGGGYLRHRSAAATKAAMWAERSEVTR